MSPEISDDVTASESPTTKELADAFGLGSLDDRSLTRWARVYRARTVDGDAAPGGAEVVVKRTASSRERAAAMAGWTSALSAAGFPVVSPVALTTPNPQPVGEDWWVVYPWVAGDAYRGDVEQIRTAGDLLGRMHATPVDIDALRGYTWTTSDRDDVESELAGLREALTNHGGQRGDRAAAVIEVLGHRWWTNSLPAVRAASERGDLPVAGVSSDYKAANLVYTADGPVLVDPDNGGREPRLFDLALALVLFHQECPAAPGRMFTEAEWQTFASAYLAHVDLTEAERALWPAALDHMLWEEGSWAIEDTAEQTWADPRQRDFLLDLAVTTPERYPLPVR